MRRIAIYGKGGIGKSITSQNLAAALAQAGKSVMVIGCDPKADSTRLLLGAGIGGRVDRTTVLDALRNASDDIDDLQLSQLVKSGYLGIKCVESGGPEPGVGCAGRGIVASISALEQLGAFTDDLDYVLYDVLGDVVCGGFAMPIREGKASEVFIVASGELMSLYAANNICKGIARYAKSGGALLAGIICNCHNVDGERQLVNQFAKEIGSRVVHLIPRDNVVQRAEINRKTVMEFDPACHQASEYRALAQAIEEDVKLVVPSPLPQERLDALMVENGL